MTIKTLEELFAIAEKYPRIIVLGPQRSGTNFAADILAEKTGRTLYSERDFGQTSCSLDPTVTQNESLSEFITREPEYVLQAPALTCNCHTLDVQGALLCYMDRPANEIEASRKKSDWPGTKRELDKYAVAHPTFFEMSQSENLGELQRKVFTDFQKNHLSLPFVEVPFSLLSQHPRWCPPELRASFKIGQTRPEEA